MARCVLALLLVTAFALAASQGAAAEAANRKLLQENVNSALSILDRLAAGNSNTDAGATALLDAATKGGKNGKDKAAKSLVATARNPGKLADLLKKSAKKAGRDKKKQKDVADTQTSALIAAKNSGEGVSDFANGAAKSLEGSPESQAVTSMALAGALAQGPSGQSAAADATASVYCDKSQGQLSPSAAAAWGTSFAVALAQDPVTGCLTLNTASSLALATCGPAGQQALTRDSALSRQIGICQKIPGLNLPSLAIAGGSSGSTATGNAGGEASANGVATVPSPRPSGNSGNSAQIDALIAQFMGSRG